MISVSLSLKGKHTLIDQKKKHTLEKRNNFFFYIACSKLKVNKNLLCLRENVNTTTTTYTYTINLFYSFCIIIKITPIFLTKINGSTIKARVKMAHILLPTYNVRDALNNILIKRLKS